MAAIKVGKHCRLVLFIFYSLFTHYVIAQPKANFKADITNSCAPLVVTFSDLSTGNPTSWKWDLGNGTTSLLQNPSVTYFTPGQYTIKLVVKNALGADSLIKTKYITVFALPTVAFGGTPLIGCKTLSVTFTDSSKAGSGNITSWQWDFGDGTIGSTQNPTHLYASPGSYNVTLQVQNSFGCIKNIMKPAYVLVGTGIVPDFSNTLPQNCTGPNDIQFQNLSTGSGTLSYKWDFGDGATSTETNPNHHYTNKGSYKVKLVVTSNTGCKDSIVKNNAVVIGMSPSFSSPGTVCINTSFTLTNTSVPTPTSVMWDFGDGTTSNELNPTKTYKSAGFYKIKLTAQVGNCIDSAIKFITIASNPVINFSANSTVGCTKPANISFTNNTINGASFTWDFGDGATSNDKNPVHTYADTGTYTVTLIATSAKGCTDTLRKKEYIKILVPDVKIDNKPDSGCVPFTKKFSATVNSPDPAVSYLWDFGDGATSNEVNPVHNFTQTGVYTIKLTITTAQGCTDTAMLTDGIIVTDKPTANFSANPLNACASVPIQFTDLSSSNVTKWLWKFGDYDTSTLQNPSHVYLDTGYMNVTLIVWNRGCMNQVTFPKYIYIKPPIARFNYGYFCNDPYTKLFYQHSIGADEWLWDFGDGTTSTDKHPVHVFPAKGQYVVRLTVKNWSTGCSYATSRTIYVIKETPDFTANTTSICKKEKITFSASGVNTNLIRYYYWEYGDGIKDTGMVVSHVYNEAGNYTVRLITVDLMWCRDTMTKPMYIRVNGPTAKFSVPPTGNCLLSPTTFIDNSVDDGLYKIVKWNWDFGDGTHESLSGPPFIHTYNSTGNYVVRLDIIDENGCKDSTTLEDTLLISKPKADFSTPNIMACPETKIGFIDASNGMELSYQWDFGDGTSSNSAKPVHQYAQDGVYTVKLIVTDKNGCSDTMNREKYITVLTPHASFTISDSTGTCPPLVVDFKNTSTNIGSVVWDFGDGTSTTNDNPTHFYTSPGTYYAKLTVIGPGGCSDIMSKKIVVLGPTGTFTYNPFIGCNPSEVKFESSTTNTVSFIWDFNDGTVINSNDAAIAHTYTAKGDYLPKMIVVDLNGCKVPVQGNDTIRIKEVTANFNVSGKLLCDNGAIQFSDASNSNDAIVEYKWDFGDGTSSIQQNPLHFYDNVGLFYPKLITTTLNGCVDSISYPTPIKIVASPQTKIVSTPNGCTPLQITFNGQLLAQDTSALTWKWDFKNGSLSNLKDPPTQVYTKASTYNIQLVVTNSSGCTDTTYKSIEAYPIPDVSAGTDKGICVGNGTTLNATGADTYTWSPATNLNCTDCSSPFANPVKDIVYSVKGTTVYGCTNTDSVKVIVKHPFILKTSPGDTLCMGSSKQLFAQGGYTYEWTPATGLSATNIANPLASPSTTTLYTVVGTDELGCFKDTAYLPLTVYPVPTVNAGEDQTINVGKSTTIPLQHSNDVSKVFWMPHPSIIATNQDGFTVQPKETTEYNVEVRNEGGCRASDKVTVFVICNDANVFIPNTFSPNGDGVNDKFYPRGTGLFRIKSMRIFNRWGQVVYERSGFMPNDASAGWDGTFKSTKINPDVYVYTIEIYCDNNSVLSYKGNITLIQ